MKPQLQTVTIGGQPYAIVPLAEYDALREDLEDAGVWEVITVMVNFEVWE